MTHHSRIGFLSLVRVAAVLLALLTCGSEASAQRLKVILDTDIGGDIDDAWALGFAMQSPDIDLLGVTITDQNTPARAKVACKLLHAGGRAEVPVAVGRRTGDHVDYQFAWAEDFTAKTPIAQPAADFIVETVRGQPGEITLVAVGPLQNVADALRKAPPDVGVDLLFVDGEDYGSFDAGQDQDVLIGSRYYAAHLPAGPLPRYAVLFDMVGDRDLHILREGSSVTGAPTMALPRIS